MKTPDNWAGITTEEIMFKLSLDFKFEPHQYNNIYNIIYEKLSEETPNDNKFIGHIQGHLGMMEEVICKFCGKTAKEIVAKKTLKGNHVHKT